MVELFEKISEKLLSFLGVFFFGTFLVKMFFFPSLDPLWVVLPLIYIGTIFGAWTVYAFVQIIIFTIEKIINTWRK